MPAVASLEELKAVEENLSRLKAGYPEAYADVVELFRRHRKVGNRARWIPSRALPLHESHAPVQRVLRLVA